MNENKHAIALNLQAQWQDHFHMRDQTWKVLQYSILFFLGVIGLEIKAVDKAFLILSYGAVLCTSAFGVVIAVIAGIGIFLEQVGKHKDSMCQDIANKMPTEIDFLGGKVVEYAREKGISAPFYIAMTNLVKAIDKGIKMFCS